MRVELRLALSQIPSHLRATRYPDVGIPLLALVCICLLTIPLG